MRSPVPLTDLLEEVIVALGEDPFRREVLLLQTLVLSTVRIAYTEADATPALVADIDRGVFGSIAQACPGVAWDMLLEEERYRLEVLTGTEAIGTEVQTGAKVAIALYATEGDTVAAGGATDEVVTPDAVLVEVLHGEVTLAWRSHGGGLPATPRSSCCRDRSLLDKRFPSFMGVVVIVLGVRVIQ